MIHSGRMFDPIAAIERLVRQPSVSTDPAYSEGMQQTRAELCSLLQSIGLDVEVIETKRHPVVLAKRGGPADWPHVIIYGHYDVQPPDPVELWSSPPFAPTHLNGRLYGRGSADNKGPMMVHIAAVASLLEEQPDLPLRITFLIEGEEEIGSPSLPEVLQARAAELQADFILLSDTLNPSDDQVAVTIGLRGMMCFEFEVAGPKGDLHSGMYGGAVYNPIQALTEICASLHTDDGRVNVPGFYDAVVRREQWECDEINRLAVDDAEFAQRIGVPATHTPPGRNAMEATRLEPTLEFNGIYGGYTGAGEKTIIPSKATTKVSCRLVANQDPVDIREKVFAAIRERCPAGVRLTIREGHHGMPYSVVPPGHPNTPAEQNPHLARAFAAAHASISEVFGSAPLYMPEGGSIPIIGEMHRLLGLECLMLGIGTAANNLHAPNESVLVDTLHKGIRVSRQILLATAQGH